MFANCDSGGRDASSALLLLPCCHTQPCFPRKGRLQEPSQQPCLVRRGRRAPVLVLGAVSLGPRAVVSLLLPQVTAAVGRVSFPSLRDGTEAHPRPSWLSPCWLAPCFTQVLLACALLLWQSRFIFVSTADIGHRLLFASCPERKAFKKLGHTLALRGSGWYPRPALQHRLAPADAVFPWLGPWPHPLPAFVA